MMLVASCIPFSLFAPCNDMLAMLVYATRWLSMHLYNLVYIVMHESCLPVCCPCFNTMKLWTFDPNLHLSLTNTTFCLFSCLFFFSFVCSLSCFFACHVYHTYLLYASFVCSLHLFLPLLVCRFPAFAFACTHIVMWTSIDTLWDPTKILEYLPKKIKFRFLIETLTQHL